MKEYQQKTFFEALFGGIGDARDVVRPVVEKTTTGSKGIVREVWRQEKLEIRSAVAAKVGSVYRRRLRLA